MNEASHPTKREVLQLINSRQSLELATASGNAIPFASYAPYVYGGNMRFFVLLSDLAQHTRNLKHNLNASVMIIEDENQAANLFARERFSAHCQVTKHARNTAEFTLWTERYKARFGSIVDTLTQLADFNLYSLAATEATYIRGFGQAYRISGSDMAIIEHISNPAANNSGKISKENNS